MQHTGIKKYVCDDGNFDKIKQFILDVEPKTVLLWGGEPLLYWERFTAITDFIRSYSISCFITTITNGSLLTEEKIKYINNNNIYIGLSNDAFATKETRFNDILTNRNLFNLFKKIKNKSINTVISSKTQDIYSVWEYYDKLFNREVINVNFEVLKNLKYDKELGSFDFDKFQATLVKLKEDFIGDVLKERYESRAFLFFRPLLNLTDNQLNTVDKKYLESLYHLKCGTMTSVIVIDFNGNIYMCKNSDKIIGNIDDIEKARKELSKEIKIPAWCKECPYLFICDPAGCVVEDETSKKDSCKINKMIYQTFFEALEEILSIQKQNNVL